MIFHFFSNSLTFVWNCNVFSLSSVLDLPRYTPFQTAFQAFCSSFVKSGLSSLNVSVLKNVEKSSCWSISLLQNLILSIRDCLLVFRFSMSHLMNGATSDVINPPPMAEMSGTNQLSIITSPRRVKW